MLEYNDGMISKMIVDGSNMIMLIIMIVKLVEVAVVVVDDGGRRIGEWW